jgi:hypothetical protein
MFVLLVQVVFQVWEVGASIHVFVWIVGEQLEGVMSNHNVYCQGLSSIKKFTCQDPTRSSCSVSISFDPGLQR